MKTQCKFRKRVTQSNSRKRVKQISPLSIKDLPPPAIRPEGSVPITYQSYSCSPGIKCRYRTGYVQPRPRVDVPAVSASGSPKTKQQPKSKVPPGRKSDRDIVNGLIEHASDFVDALAGLEPEPSGAANTCADCRTARATFRCEECYLCPIVCRACIISRHTYEPLHRVVQWSKRESDDGPDVGRFPWQRIELSVVGLVTYLDHRGAPCYNTGSTTAKDMVVVRTNSLHHVRVIYCGCPTRGSARHQLMRAGFCPASTERIRTVVTLTALRDFSTLAQREGEGLTECAYFAKLRELSGENFQDKGVGRYKAFVRAMRLWRHLQSRMSQAEAAA
ncbi:hypothetical protein JB92DRAFT_776042 [Gautieria morchelliformis]|nr:hypothetical protein JB92DRAFT_776042 [Gautieria morchelliformis]